MNQTSRQLAQSAIEAFEAAIGQGSKVKHEQIAEAVRRLIRLRNRLLERARAGDMDGPPLSQVNALVSLAHGAERPLMGVHLHRMEGARDGLRTLVTQRSRALRMARQRTRHPPSVIMPNCSNYSDDKNRWLSRVAVRTYRNRTRRFLAHVHGRYTVRIAGDSGAPPEVPEHADVTVRPAGRH